jgi:hypothetical protein
MKGGDTMKCNKSCIHWSNCPHEDYCWIEGTPPFYEMRKVRFEEYFKADEKAMMDHNLQLDEDAQMRDLGLDY